VTAKDKKFTAPILLVGATADDPDIEYASGFRAPDPVVFLKYGPQRHLVVPQLELGRAARTCPGVTVHSPEALGLRRGRRGRLGHWALALCRLVGAKRVVVPGSFPHGVAVRLQRHGVALRIAQQPLFPERAVKRAAECRRIAEAQQAAVIAMRAAVDRIAASRVDAGGFLVFRGQRLSSRDVKQVITRILLEHDCLSPDTIVAGGVQAADPHEKGDGPLRAHEAIVIDIFPRHQEHGYWGDLTRTVVKGTPAPALRRMYQAVRAAQAAALSAVRAGVKAATVHAAAADVFTQRGFRTERRADRGVGFIHSTGHGVGLAIHEAPSVGPGGTRLRSGNVITIEPGLYYPEIGGVRLEDTIVVTPQGWRYLVPCEKRFQV
jgi:Xaa-Pro aminopeptidase